MQGTKVLIQAPPICPMQKTNVKEKAKDKHLIDQLTRRARKHGDGQKAAIWGNSGLFFLCRAYFDCILILVGIPCYNWIRTLVPCMAFPESGNKGTHIRGLECRKNSSERASQKKRN